MISGDLALAGKPSAWKKILALAIALVTAVALATILAFQNFGEANRLELGQVSPRTILAPSRVTYASDFQTHEAQVKAEALVKDVYDPPNPERARAQVAKAGNVLDFVDTVRHDPYSDPSQKSRLVSAIPDLYLSQLSVSRTLALDENAFHRVVSETLYVVDSAMRDEIRSTDLNTALAKLPSRVSLALPADQADLVAQWARPFIAPNAFFNPNKTEDARAAEKNRVGTVYRTIEKGEAIVRENEVITPLAMEALEELRLLNSRRDVIDAISTAIFAIIIVVLLSTYITRLRPTLLAYPRSLLLISFLLLIAAIVGQIFIIERSVLNYLIPFSVVAMLLAVLIDVPVALGASLVLALVIGFRAPNSFELGTYTLVGSWVAALGLGRIERSSAFLWSSLYVAAANLATAALFRIMAHETGLAIIAPYLLATLANAALSGFIALGSLYFLGRVFGITTSLDLLELTRPTHPLLQKLLTEAPGTYHHSLIVSHLAEQAAQKIGADALLVRVAAYYHDIGKTREPQSFVENQLDGVNVHDTLDPVTSASIVIDHVQRGIALAQMYHLPPRIREMIPQHHGTTLAAYFHHKAKETGAAPVNEDAFRYAGPKPQSREAGILMLADGVEATARAEHPATPEQIHAIINRIVGERLRDGQLDESNLTLRDVQRVKDAFFGVLQGMFHARVKYPNNQSAVISLQKKRASRDSRS